MFSRILRLDFDSGCYDHCGARLHDPDQLPPEREVLQVLHQLGEGGRQPGLRNLLLR